jgi:hypothetical protein
MGKLSSTLSHITQSKPSLSSLTTTIKNNPKSTLALSVLGGPVAVAAVLAVEHKDEIKSTLSKAGETVKHEASVIKKDTISVASTVKKDVTKAAKVVSTGMGNLYMYGMLAVGAIILLKFI